jgi:hypothetical protein
VAGSIQLDALHGHRGGGQAKAQDIGNKTYTHCLKQWLYPEQALGQRLHVLCRAALKTTSGGLAG